MLEVLDRRQTAQETRRSGPVSSDIRLDTPKITTVIVQVTSPNAKTVLREKRMSMVAPTIDQIKAAIASPAQAENVAPLQRGDQKYGVVVEIGGQKEPFTATGVLPEGAVVKFVDP